MAKQPEEVKVSLPSAPITMTGDAAVPKFNMHLYSDASGIYRVKLGSWESHVVKVESSRPQFVAWYRNPTGGERCVRIPYRTGSGYGKLYPADAPTAPGDRREAPVESGRSDGAVSSDSVE